MMETEEQVGDKGKMGEGEDVEVKKEDLIRQIKLMEEQLNGILKKVSRAEAEREELETNASLMSDDLELFGRSTMNQEDLQELVKKDLKLVQVLLVVVKVVVVVVVILKKLMKFN